MDAFKILIIIVLAGILAIFLSCFSCKKIHDGYVTEKQIIPAHNYRYATIMYCGKIPITTYHTGYVDDEYVLSVTKIIGVDTITDYFSVNQSTYKCKSVGDYFNDTIPCEIYKQK